jgi:hypothetical protein
MWGYGMGGGLRDIKFLIINSIFMYFTIEESNIN